MKISKTLVGVICILAAIAVGAAQWYLVNVASTAAVPVVCAKVEIPSGTKITADMLEIKKMGKLNLPANISGDTDKVVGSCADTDIQTGDMLTNAKFSENAPASILQDGQMLYSVTVKNLADSLSGKLQSGDIVRVVVTAQNTGNNAVVGGNAAQLQALQYVRVESVTASNGQSVENGSQTASASASNQPATVTLYVNEKQVEALAALGSNEISFALVSRGSESKAKALLAEQSAALEGLQ